MTAKRKRPFKATGKFTVPNPGDTVVAISGYGGGVGEEVAETVYVKRSDLEGKTVTVGKRKP